MHDMMNVMFQYHLSNTKYCLLNNLLPILIFSTKVEMNVSPYLYCLMSFLYDLYLMELIFSCQFCSMTNSTNVY